VTVARAAIFLVVALVALLALVRLLQPRLAFFPFRGEPTTPRDLGLDYEPITIATADGERLRAWLIPHPTPRAFIVYFHGNGGHLSMWAPIVAGVARRGYSVLAVDYRGYGVSTGRPTERGLYRDVEAVVEDLWTRVKPESPVVYWGRSLGVSMAAYAATRRAPAGVILESGFPDARSLLRASPPMAFLGLFTSYRFPAAEYLRDAKVPALVIHGDADSVIPFDQGRALYDRIGGPKDFFVIRGGDHNDAAPTDEGAYWTAVHAFVARLGRRDAAG
jgi:fermentation-respiration switch protein FrsA (DUF1100 family)